MHAIISCATTTPFSSDAGRLPIFAPIPSHNVVDILQAAALDVKVINLAKDLPVAASPVPLKFKRACDSLDGIVLADHVALIKHINKLEAFGKLEGRTPRPWMPTLQSSLPSCAGTVNKIQDLDCQGALSGDNSPGDGSIVLGESGTCLKRARKINKRAGLDVLKCRESKKARLLGGPILQAHLRP